MDKGSVYGRNLTFDNFEEEDGLYTVSQAQGGDSDPIQDTMFGALYALLHGSANSEVANAHVIDALWFSEVKGDANSLVYVPPSMDSLVDALWGEGGQPIWLSPWLSSRATTVWSILVSNTYRSQAELGTDRFSLWPCHCSPPSRPYRLGGDFMEKNVSWFCF